MSKDLATPKRHGRRHRTSRRRSRAKPSTTAPAIARVDVARPAGGRRIVRVAGLIAAGNLAGSLLGLIRLQIINGTFGQTATAGAFFAALKTPQQIAELLVGGAVGGALIPLFVEYHQPERRAEFQRIFATLATVVVIVLTVAALALALTSPFLVPLINAGFASTDQALTTRLVVILTLMIPGLGLVAVASAALYALRQPRAPAFATVVAHLGVIAGALVLSHWWGIASLAVGTVLGIAGQVALLVFVLRRAGVRFRFALDLRHPALRQVWRLYAPVLVGLLLSIIVQQLDQWLQSQTLDPATGIRGGPSVAALASATMLIQFPAGLVASALSFAALPELARAREIPERFAAIIGQGIQLGLLCMVPIAVIYLTLSEPIIALLFQRQAFGTADTARTALALRGYAWQLPFLVIEQVAIAAFFARKRTVVPLITGAISILAYLVVALSLTPSWGMPALALANTAQHVANALILLGLLSRERQRLAPSGDLWKILFASAIMAITSLALGRFPVGTSGSLFAQLSAVVIPSGGGITVYFSLLWITRVDNLGMISQIMRQRDRAQANNRTPSAGPSKRQ